MSMMKSTVLLVDDDPNLTAALRRRLHKEGYHVLEAHSGKQALALLSEESVDVLVTDEKMPGMAGSELVALVARRQPDVIRMILSGQATLDAAIRAINGGQIYRFFLKPCDETDLLVTIRQALAQKELARENEGLRREITVKTTLLQQMEQENPGITEVHEDDEGALVIDARETVPVSD